MDSHYQSYSKHVQDDVYNYCQSNWCVQSWKRNGVDYGCRGIGWSWLWVTRETNKDVGTNHEKDWKADSCDVKVHSQVGIWALNTHEKCQQWRRSWNTRVCNCMLNNVSTCFDQMTKEQRRQSIDRCCSEKASQNQLEIPFMVKLDELSWLKNGSTWVPSLKVDSPSVSGRFWWDQEQRGCPSTRTKAKGRQTVWSFPEAQGTVRILLRSKRSHTGKKDYPTFFVCLLGNFLRLFRSYFKFPRMITPPTMMFVVAVMLRTRTASK